MAGLKGFVLKSWLKNAFAVESEDGQEPQAEERRVADEICRTIAARRMTTPALIFLEASRPLNYVGAQMLHFFAPFVTSLYDTPAYLHFARFLERRGSVDYLSRKLQELADHAPESVASRKDASAPGDAG
jgi:hypothetical protein